MITAETRVTLSVSEANRLHRYAQAQAEMAACAGRNAVMAGLKLGKLLTDLKAATDHGVWGQLFKKESNTKLSSCAQFENDRTAPSTPPELVAKATDGAETPRQMMLNLGVIATRKRTTHDRVKPLGFTGSGNPDGAQALTPMDKLANDLAALNLPPEELERRRHQAEQDAACLLKQLGTFVDQGYVHLLRLQERELFADSLAAYARKVSDADEQSIRATMGGIANGTTTL